MKHWTHISAQWLSEWGLISSAILWGFDDRSKSLGWGLVIRELHCANFFDTSKTIEYHLKQCFRWYNTVSTHFRLTLPILGVPVTMIHSEPIRWIELYSSGQCLFASPRPDAVWCIKSGTRSPVSRFLSVFESYNPDMRTGTATGLKAFYYI